MYQEFIENNDWEGETWSHFVKIEGNEDKVAKIKQLFEEFGGEVFVVGKVQDTTTADVLVENSDSGYMARYAFSSKLPSLEDLNGISDHVTLSDVFYKGQGF